MVQHCLVVSVFPKHPQGGQVWNVERAKSRDSARHAAETCLNTVAGPAGRAPTCALASKERGAAHTQIVQEKFLQIFCSKYECGTYTSAALAYEYTVYFSLLLSELYSSLLYTARPS